MALTRKAIEVTFKLSPVTDAAGSTTAQPVFAGSNANEVTLRGLRISCNIHKAGGASQGEAQVKLYGMSLTLMNQLSTLGRTPVIIGKNEISISAGDDANGLALIFKGTIAQAYTDLGGAPEGIFQVSAYSLLYQAVQSLPPTSFKGGVGVALVLQNLATQMGMSFENNGVVTQLSNPYFEGSAKSQAEAAVRAAGIEWNACDNGILAIWPKGGSRGGSVPLISAATGMVGYPYPSGQGLLGVKTAFNPDINFGAKVEVDSIIKPAVGLWTVCSVDHDIEAEFPGGQWFSSVLGTPPGYLVVR